MQQVRAPSTGPQGIATIRLTKTSTALVTLNGKVMELPLTAFPGGRAYEGTFKVLMNSAGDKITYMTVINGDYIVKVKRLKPAQAPYTGDRNAPHVVMPPAPYIKPGRPFVNPANGMTQMGKDRLVFGVQMVVADGEPLEGIAISDTQDYRFGPAPDGNTGVWGRENGKAYQRLISFLSVSGFTDYASPLKYSENVLPELEAQIVKLDKKFKVTMENGFVSSYDTAPDLPPVSAKAKAKKATAKPKAKPRSKK